MYVNGGMTIQYCSVQYLFGDQSWYI